MNATTLDQAINNALQLPPDQQNMLIDILSKRRIEHSRQEIMTDARQSIADLRAGLFKAVSDEEAVAELHRAVEDYLPVVVQATYLNDYKIKVAFDNGEEKIANCAKWLKGEIFESLKDKSYFQRFFVDAWSISWPNGADIDPKTLYEESEPA